MIKKLIKKFKHKKKERVRAFHISPPAGFTDWSLYLLLFDAIKKLIKYILKLLLKPKFKRFTIKDFTKSDVAEEYEVDNSIKSPEIGKALIYTISIAEKVRKILDVDITITSGYRCKELNDIIWGSKTSQHLKGQAFDFQCSLTPKQVCERLKNSDLIYDQMIMYSWGVHIGCPMKRKRKQFIDKS